MSTNPVSTGEQQKLQNHKPIQKDFALPFGVMDYFLACAHFVPRAHFARVSGELGLPLSTPELVALTDRYAGVSAFAGGAGIG